MLLDLRRALQQRLEVTVFEDQLRRRLDTDAGHAGHVVHRIPRQGLHLDDFFGADAEFRQHAFRADFHILHRIQHRHLVGDELHQILVGRHDGDIGAAFPRQPGIGRDQVIGLVAVHLNRRHIEGLDQ